MLAALTSGTAVLQAQVNFDVAGHAVQIHSFATQGFLYSNQNNFLSMPTSKGSFAFTDAGANISTQLTDKFRVGAQVYLRNVGDLGNAHPVLDWALGSYKFKSWFGIRAGRVKTTLGLYNDIQDMDSLHTFALLPESIYPVDWRSSTIAHDGGDLFGDIAIKGLGTLSYTAYAGMRPQDSSSGYVNASKAVGVAFDYVGGRQMGGDLRWVLPAGLTVGASYLAQDISANGLRTVGTVTTAYRQDTKTDDIFQYYAQFTLKGFRLDAEYRKNLRDLNLYFTKTAMKSTVDQRDWYIAGAYRVNKRVELGTYYSRYFVDTRKATDPPTAHQFDTAISGRVDLIEHWYVKLEGHFLDGAPTTPSAARGFYPTSNPQGILSNTRLIIIRTGVSF